MTAIRIITILFWTVLCFIITPSKVTAIALALLVGGSLIVVIVALGVGRATIRAIRWVAKGFYL